MSTKAQLEFQLREANDRIMVWLSKGIEIQKLVPAETPKTYLYPAYTASAHVMEDDYVPNTVSWMDWMEREELSDDALENAGWARFASHQQTSLTLNPDRPHRSVVGKMKCSKMNVKRLGLQPWTLTWFAHQTFRDDRSDEQLHLSFHEYVDKYRWHQEEHRYHGPAEFEKRFGEPYVCLMGAEDTWRWKLCECQLCKDKGIAVFEH